MELAPGQWRQHVFREVQREVERSNLYCTGKAKHWSQITRTGVDERTHRSPTTP